MIASLLAATTMSMSDFSRSENVGLATNSPSIRPIRTPAIGPPHTRSEACSAADAPVIASTSVGFSLSNDTTLAMICVSMNQPLGNSGRTGRSISRQIRISSLVVRPSRRKKLPGILPDE